MPDTSTNLPMRMAAMFLMRVLLGAIFFWQGFGKVFVWKISGVYENFFKAFEETILPSWLLWVTVYYTSLVELLCGVLLIAGLWRKPSYLLLSSVLIIVAFGHGMEDYIWDAKYLLHRAILLIPLMLLPSDWDRWNLDHYIKNR